MSIRENCLNCAAKCEDHFSPSSVTRTSNVHLFHLPVFVAKVLRDAHGVFEVKYGVPPSTGYEDNITRFLYAFQRKVTFLQQENRQNIKIKRRKELEESRSIGDLMLSHYDVH